MEKPFLRGNSQAIADNQAMIYGKCKVMGKLKKKKFQGLNQSLFAGSLVLDAHPKLFQALEGHSPTRYDKIMDQVYRETHIGGGAHRHFDGSHTLKGSYDKIKKIDGSVDPVEYLKSHFKELATPEGIPLFTLDKSSHTTISHEISESLGGVVSPGHIRQYIRDMNSFNAGETVASSVGAVFLFLAFRSRDPKAISRVTACNICLGMATANPLQLFVGVAGLAYGLYQGKIKSYQLLRGAAPVISGMIAHQTAMKVFNISKNGSIMFSIGTAIASGAILNYMEQKMERKQKQSILKELGKNNPHYIAGLTPDILSREFMKLSRRTLALGSLI